MTRTFYYGFTNDFYSAATGILTKAHENVHNDSHFYLFSGLFLEVIIAYAEKARGEHSVNKRFKTSGKMELTTDYASNHFVGDCTIEEMIVQKTQPYRIAELFYYVSPNKRLDGTPERTRLVTLEFDWINKHCFFVRDSVHDAFKRNYAAKLLEGLRVENPEDGKRIAVCKRI